MARTTISRQASSAANGAPQGKAVAGGLPSASHINLLNPSVPTCRTSLIVARSALTGHYRYCTHAVTHASSPLHCLLQAHIQHTYLDVLDGRDEARLAQAVRPGGAALLHRVVGQQPAAQPLVKVGGGFGVGKRAVHRRDVGVEGKGRLHVEGDLLGEPVQAGNS